MPDSAANKRNRIRLPVVDGGDALPPVPRPVWGGPEVARYGAVGLDLSLPEPPSATGDVPSAKSADGTCDVYRIGLDEPLPLAEGLAHHLVDTSHLWLGVRDGLVLVADDLEHELMQALRSVHTPSAVARFAEQHLGLDAEQARQATAAFVGRLAAAGFIQGIQGYSRVKKPKPYAFARFHLTQRCQLECVHCYTESGPYLPSDNELPVERWLQLVDDFADNGGEKLLLTGGEALVHPGCIDIIRRAHERGLEVTLFSNGILVPRHIDVIEECVDIVQISIDGPNAESHDKVRGPGSFRKAIRALRMLLEAGVQARLSTTIMDNNWEAVKRDLPAFIAEFEHTSLQYNIGYGAMDFGRGENLDHDSVDINETRAFVDDLLKRVGDDNREEGRNAVQKSSGCGYAEQLVVSPEGVVYPCHLLSGPLGHVDDLPLPQITRYLEKTAEAFSVDHREGCGTCDLRNLCGGTCRVEDERITGSRFITTCTATEKLRKKRFLVRRYRPVSE